MKRTAVNPRAVLKSVAALAWTALVVMALLHPGNDWARHQPSLSSFLASFFSMSLDKYNFREGLVHVILFAILSALWVWALAPYFLGKRAIALAFGIAVVIGTGTEVGQYFVQRGSLFLDLVANFIGTVFVLGWANCRNRSTRPVPGI